MASQSPKKGRKEFATCHRLWPSFGPWWAATATRSGTGLPETGGTAVAVGDIGLLSVARGCSVRDIGGGRSIAQKAAWLATNRRFCLHCDCAAGRPRRFPRFSPPDKILTATASSVWLRRYVPPRATRLHASRPRAAWARRGRWPDGGSGDGRRSPSDRKSTRLNSSH